MTGVLLVGGASRRFGAPKALARFEGRTLAERAHATLAEAFGRVIVVGKQADALPLPFPVVDDASDVRAAIVGVVAGLRSAPTEIAVVVPTDMPFLTAALLRSLADAVLDPRIDAAVASGPLPLALRRSARHVLEERVAAGDLALHRALAVLETRTIGADAALLRNVNTPADLA